MRGAGVQAFDRALAVSYTTSGDSTPRGRDASEHTETLDVGEKDRHGARWKDETAGHIVDLRAIALSDYLDEELRLILSPLRKTVRAAA